ncbi:MAG TPA: hypothetical protein VFE13_04035 [Caulobacteraceae bacterium]|jgi:hypothetical protein|nr:hypothetical protein [Caulobacteraceae bacterium]
MAASIALARGFRAPDPAPRQRAISHLSEAAKRTAGASPPRHCFEPNPAKDASHGIRRGPNVNANREGVMPDRDWLSNLEPSQATLTNCRRLSMSPRNGCWPTTARSIRATAAPSPFPCCCSRPGSTWPTSTRQSKLSQVLEKRGWTRVPVGSQQAGDVGSTCGPTPHHGYDHIYLVLQPLNVDEMVIADNQAPAPHFRFASGKGHTPTQFFLRAS